MGKVGTRDWSSCRYAIDRESGDQRNACPEREVSSSS